MFGLTVARPILQMFIEVFIYSFETDVPVDPLVIPTNAPTTVAVVVSYVIVAVWIVWLNHGKSALGVSNLEEFPDLKFWDWDFKKLIYSLKLLPSALVGLS